MESALRTLIALIQPVNSQILSWTILELHEDSLKPEKNDNLGIITGKTP